MLVIEIASVKSHYKADHDLEKRRIYADWPGIVADEIINVIEIKISSLQKYQVSLQ